jgi:hypothetical protein
MLFNIKRSRLEIQIFQKKKEEEDTKLKNNYRTKTNFLNLIS